MLRENLKNSRKKSKRAMANLNYLDLVSKGSRYFRDIENIYSTVILPECVDREPVLKALVIIENKKAAGQLDELNQLKVA